MRKPKALDTPLFRAFGGSRHMSANEYVQSSSPNL